MEQKKVLGKRSQFFHLQIMKKKKTIYKIGVGDNLFWGK